MVIMKKDIKLTINEELLNRGKEEIPNMSKWVENCLDRYFNYEDYECDFDKKLKEEHEKIREGFVNIHLMTSAQHRERNERKAKKEKINRPWRKLWSIYQSRNGYYDIEDLEEVMDVTDMEEVELKDMLQILNFVKNIIDDDSVLLEFNTAYDFYKEYKDEI